MIQPDQQLENARGAMFTLHNCLHRVRGLADSPDYDGEKLPPLLTKVTKAVLALARYLTDQHYAAADRAAVERQLHYFILRDYCRSHITIQLPDGCSLHLDGEPDIDVKIWMDQQLGGPKIKVRWKQLVQAAVLR